MSRRRLPHLYPEGRSHDHWVRDERELERITAYIENNPVKAGLAPNASLYRWSSGWKDGELKFAAAR